MNARQREVVIYGLYGLAGLLVFIFWAFGSQIDYAQSILVFETRRVPPSYPRPELIHGLRIRMGVTGVLMGAVLPVLLAGAGAFIQRSDSR